MAEKNTTSIGFEKQIWDAACVLRATTINPETTRSSRWTVRKSSVPSSYRSSSGRPPGSSVDSTRGGFTQTTIAASQYRMSIIAFTPAPARYPWRCGKYRPWFSWKRSRFYNSLRCARPVSTRQNAFWLPGRRCIRRDPFPKA